ncbi:MAG: hypothetical protein HRU25_06425 [Psychrobium sp.]|nr:hypothetical protein [Psychrobium sp.]
MIKQAKRAIKNGLTYAFFFVAMTPIVHANAQESLQSQRALYELDYRVALFHHFQGDDLKALREMSRLESLPSKQFIDNLARLNKGKMSLSFGLIDNADNILTALDRNLPSSIDSSSSWLENAKYHYKSGNWLAAQQALDQVTEPLDNVATEQASFFNAQLALKKDQMSRFNNHRNNVIEDKDLAAYLRHNHLLTKAQAGQITQFDLLELITQSFTAQDATPQSAEQQAIAQRSMLVLGYAFIEQGKNELAINAFQRIDIDSHVLEPALLGYELALNNLAQYSLAKNVFSRLASRDNLSIYVQEAILGEAYSSEQLGDEKTSVAKLRQGIKRLSAHKSQLRSLLIKFAVDSSCFSALIDQNSSFWCHEDNQDLLGMAFIEMLSQQQFSFLSEQILDVASLTNNLQQRSTQLDVYNELLNNKQKLSVSRIQYMKQNNLKKQVADLIARRDDIAKRITFAKGVGNGSFFLPPKEAALLTGVKKAAMRFRRLDRSNKQTKKYRTRLRRIEGLVLWHVLYKRDENISQTDYMNMQLNEQTQVLQDHLQQLIDDTSHMGEVRSQLADIAALKQKTLQQIDVSRELISRLKHKLHALIEQHFTQRQSQLSQAITNAKFSIVRLQDASYQRNQAKISRITGDK